jgi:hypothetical protein
MSAKYISRSSAVAARELGGEMIIMSAPDSTLFSLNETASVIWLAADGKTPLAEIVERRICQEFDVALDVAYRDAEELVNQLAAHGILLLSDAPVTPAPLEPAKKP